MPQASIKSQHAPTASLASDSGQPAVPIRLTAASPRPGTRYAAIEQLSEKAHSENDNWQTEVLSEAASAQLGRLAKQLKQPNVPDAEFLRSVVAREFECQTLRPAGLGEVYQDGVITVRRADEENSFPDAANPSNSSGIRYSGPAGFQRALAELDAALGTGAERHAKFKLYRIDSGTTDPPAAGQNQTTFDTLVRYEVSRHGSDGSKQQTAVWRCRWTYMHGDQTAARETVPLLTHVAASRYEEADVAGLRGPTVTGGPLFVDCTESALQSNASYHQQVLPGINHWVRRIPREFIGMLGYNGLAVGDVNGDGLDDLYVCDSGGLPNRLYVQQRDGTARDVSAEVDVDFLDDSTSALLIDVDNDGDQDLVVAMDPNLQIAENDGAGRFKLHPPLEVNTDSLSICAADYDADGDLDVYVCGYNVRKQDATNRGLPFPMPYYDANNGGRNVLLRNDGNFRFADVTREVGLDENNSRFSMAAAWEDFDNDGDQDLYVANDFGRKNLYQNNGGHFTDIAAGADVEDTGSGMSVSWDDYNRDGRMDLYVGNMWSSAGNRVTYQPKFAAGKADVAVNQSRRMARGNTLFKNVSEDGAAKFTDVSEDEAVELGRWAWSSKFVDLTNDGWPDLLVANGYVTNTIPHDL
ncbi:MAG TPA: VCBS repeat-containing protein [Lacipirellulaceae bacterium]|nr:VCBS repeat-containing protein [Lacipirellulaceae bacterium]